MGRPQIGYQNAVRKISEHPVPTRGGHDRIVVPQQQPLTGRHPGKIVEVLVQTAVTTALCHRQRPGIHPARCFPCAGVVFVSRDVHGYLVRLVCGVPKGGNRPPEQFRAAPGRAQNVDQQTHPFAHG
jgi:hypothetical protein